MVDLLAGKGYTVSRIVTSRAVVSIMAQNDKVVARSARVRVLSSSDVFGRATVDRINAELNAEGLPDITTYDLLYRTQEGTARFLADDVMVFLAETGQEPGFDMDADTANFPAGATLGYTAIGRAVGQAEPGRVLRAEAFRNKPPRIEFEGWQASLPVVTDPEAVAVITGIA
jgi:hypothetical protein